MGTLLHGMILWIDCSGNVDLILRCGGYVVNLGIKRKNYLRIWKKTVLNWN